MVFEYYIKNKRILAVLLLGFSSGLPLALTGSTLQAWFAEAGINIVTIGTLTLLGLPYVWKFVWAPLLDRYIPPFLSRRRGWILLAQLGLCVTLFLMANLTPGREPGMIGVLALTIAFLSATQDIAIDAYRTDILFDNERRLGAAVFTFGYRFAMLVSGGVALIIADHWGWRILYQIMACMIAISVLTTYFSPNEDTPIVPRSFLKVIKESYLNLIQRDKIVLILLFVLLYKMGDALAISLMSTFLLKGLGFTLTDVGIAYKTGGLIAAILGAFFAGILLIRIRLFQALLYFGLLQAFSNIFFVLLATTGKNYTLMFGSIFIESFCSGMSTAAFVAFIMSLCDKRYSALQYALLSALFSLARVLAGPVASNLVIHYGWSYLFWCSFILCFPSLFILMLLRHKMGMNNAAVIV